MKQKLIRLFAGLTLVMAAFGAHAQFTSGQVLTAAQLNNALAAKTSNASAAITGGTITGLSAPIPLASGGTNANTATGAASQLQYLAPGTGGTARTYQSKFGDVVNAVDYNAKCDGSTDDSTAFTNAENALGVGGGTVVVPPNVKCLINSNFTVNSNVTIQGPYGFVGTPGSNSSAPYGNMGALLVNSAATITLSSGAGLRGLLIYRSGMTFPAADSSAFAGTAVTIGGNDTFVFNTMILGFNKGIYSSGYRRQRFEYINGDNNNGIEVTNATDIPYISHCHMWPFATIAANGAHTSLERSGYAYWLHDTVDWGKITDSFSYGYQVGIELNNVNSNTIVNSGADDTFSGSPLHVNSIGIEVQGNSSDNRLIDVQSSAHASAGIHINTNAGQMTTIIGADVWGGSTHGALIDGGDVMIVGSVFGGLVSLGNGVTDNNTSSKVTVSSSRFGTITGNPINVSVATTTLYLSNNDYGSTAAGTAATGTTTANLSAASIASASTLNLPTTGSDFIVTGTTNFGSLNGGWAGRQVTLYFSGALTIFSGAGATSNMRLSGSANITTASGTTLTLRHNGVQWYQVGESN